jgi:Transposase DDE domain
METIVQYAQSLVYSLLALMPSHHQRESLEAQLGLFLEAQGHPLPQHSPLKSASALSRFLNQYLWPTLSVVRTTRRAILHQIEAHLPHLGSTLYILIDLTTLPKVGKFRALSSPMAAPAEAEAMGSAAEAEALDPWVRMLNGKRGLHIVMLYIVVGPWRIPWSFKIWHGKGHPSPNQLACKLLATVPGRLTSRFKTVVVLADTEFGTPLFVSAVRDRQWRAVVGFKGNRKLQDGRSVKDLYRKAKRGAQVQVEGFDYPVTLSWFWLKRADGKRELRFVASTYPYSGAYLIRLGRQRWAIEGFFKTIKHRFGLHRFGQSTRLGIYRWLILALIAYLLAHWIDQRALPPTLDWQQAAQLALKVLFPIVLWKQLLLSVRTHADIAAQFGFEFVLKPLPRLDC